MAGIQEASITIQQITDLVNGGSGRAVGPMSVESALLALKEAIIANGLGGGASLDGAPVTQVFADVAAAGAADTASRSDHRHGMPANPTTLSDATPDAVRAAQGGLPGVSTEVARTDHRHPVTTPPAPTTLVFGDVAAAGVSQVIPRADHRHGMPASPIKALWAQAHAIINNGTLSAVEQRYGVTDIGGDGVDGTATLSIAFPSDFGALVNAKILVGSPQTGNVRWQIVMHRAAPGEDRTTHSLAPPAQTSAIVANEITEFAFSPAPDANDVLGIQIIRTGSHVDDTISRFYLYGVLIRYTSI